jgi:hypothetical protein
MMHDDPTPDEIAARAAQIRAKWSEGQQAAREKGLHMNQRRSQPSKRWTVPEIVLAEWLPAEANDAST